MADLFLNPLFQRAILGAMIVAASCAVMGVFLLLRREVFLAEAIAHGSLSGVALAFLLGVEPLWVAMIVGLTMAIATVYIRHRTTLNTESLLAIFFPILFAIGIILLSSQTAYRPELQTYLFGSLVSIGLNEIVYALIAFVLVTVVIGLLYRELTYSTFDSVAAAVRGINVKRIDYIFTIVSTIVIIVAVKSVGIVLVTAFLIIPAATARNLSKSFGQMIPIAVIHNLIATVIGILIAPNLPPGSVIVVVSGTIFLLSLILRKFSH